ncbi:hypothetical protein TNCV_4701041 [Trichonephila clavipes]|nr:hypothetical protein TNCV_4701041 [Trichonephila clavipes]
MHRRSYETFFNQTTLDPTRKGCHKTVSTPLLPFLGLPDSQICLQSSISSWVHLGRRVGHPTSLNELEASVQQICKEMSRDIMKNLYPSMHNRAFTLRGVVECY